MPFFVVVCGEVCAHFCTVNKFKSHPDERK